MVGTHYTQGQLIYHTGQKGISYGDHVHIDQSPTRVAGDTQTGVWYNNLSVQPTSIFFLYGNENVIRTDGLNFITWEHQPYGTSGFKWWMARLLLERRKKDYE